MVGCTTRAGFVVIVDFHPEIKVGKPNPPRCATQTIPVVFPLDRSQATKISSSLLFQTMKNSHGQQMTKQAGKDLDKMFAGLLERVAAPRVEWVGFGGSDAARNAARRREGGTRQAFIDQTSYARGRGRSLSLDCECVRLSRPFASPLFFFTLFYSLEWMARLQTLGECA